MEQQLKILSPVDRPSETQALIDCGADELFCGVLSDKDSHGSQGLNRRGGLFFNLHSYKELEEVLKTAKKNNILLYLAINEFYTEEALHYAEQQVINSLDIGVNNFIISDLGLLHFIKEKSPLANIVMSIGSTSFNTETINFYANLGAKRVVIDRELTIKEIATISENSSIPLEVIILNDKCPFIDGFCNFMHNLPVKGIMSMINNPRYFYMLKGVSAILPSEIKGKFGKNYRGCELDYFIKYKDNDSLKNSLLNYGTRSLRNKFFLDSCGACNVYDLFNANIRYFKIAGRGKTLEKKRKDILLLNYARELLYKSVAKEDFYLNVRDFRKRLFGMTCKPPAQCYY